METNSESVDLLLTRVEEFSKTNLELLKLKSIDKTADIGSTLFSRLLLILAICLFSLTFTIAISFWLGELLGKVFYGFFIVAGTYGIIGLALFIAHPGIKTKVENEIIIQMTK
ncbi:MAG: hypothetical protein K8H85_01700 [Cyclobacteriaceae bacterium]|nr:hypothetical protein [Cyclobacteriaceae bacterium]